MICEWCGKPIEGKPYKQDLGEVSLRVFGWCSESCFYRYNTWQPRANKTGGPNERIESDGDEGAAGYGYSDVARYKMDH